MPRLIAHAKIGQPTGSVGPSTEIKQADDPCRAIEIVARSGQLYATNSKRPIVTARATQKVPVQPSLVKKSVAGTRSSQLDIFLARLIKFQLAGFHWDIAQLPTWALKMRPIALRLNSEMRLSRFDRQCAGIRSVVLPIARRQTQATGQTSGAARRREFSSDPFVAS
ncbi:MAG TPA: hypothetical protein VLM42_08130 [Bryobacteraceae bacterium]|nr:hypothetical protein [Bryobacteraceae bacterium]